MLKALELSGFKSFADKTRFDFPSGITVIVGPNGSGKSNVVDAIKWVLGEQSAKSLRGKEMADVIFKGSNSRKAANTAEATIIFDNSEGKLAVDAPEVHVTRRVYRSGEGEYLINRQACRLKDVRDLFRGTGVGADAYSLIEQGKVDRLLQASAKDRRAIFEEAAGISRFKAKKIEAQRRLERVEQNLLRLSDIVDEVGSRLRSMRSQATKARRYREYSNRLKELRTQVALAEWRELSRKLQGAENRLGRLRDEVARIDATCSAQDARSLELETEIVSISESVRDREHQASRNQQAITASQSLIEHERQRVAELEEEAGRYQAQLAMLGGRAEDVTARVRQTRDLLEVAEEEYRRASQQLQEHDALGQQLAAQLSGRREQIDRRREQHLDLMRSLSTLATQVTSLEADRNAVYGTVRRCDGRLAELESEHASHADQLRTAEADERRLVSELAESARQLEAADLELDENVRLVARRRDELAAQHGRLNGLVERVSLLDELERRHEGLTAGVQQVLELAKQDNPGPFGEVVGLVADVIDVPMQWAPLIDATLGPVAQHVVLTADAVLEALATGHFRPSGRVGFVMLDDETRMPADESALLQEQPGVLGRLDQMVQTPLAYRPLIRRLLGRVWAVETLQQARRLRATGFENVQFVTRHGEVVRLDGSVLAGPKDIAALISRRSELKVLRRDRHALERQIHEATSELARLENNIEDQRVVVRKLTDQQTARTEQLGDRRVQVRTARRFMDELRREQNTLQAERLAAQQELDRISSQLDTASQQASDRESQIAVAEEALDQAQHQIARVERHWQQHQRVATTMRIDRAKSEQRLEGLRSQLKQFEDDQRERSVAITDTRHQWTQVEQRACAARMAILDATSQLANLFLRKERLLSELTQAVQRQNSVAAQRVAVSEQLRESRKELSNQQQLLHQLEMAATQLQLQRRSLAERLRDDYGIDIAAMENQTDQLEIEQGEAVDQEIAALKRKISNIGAVNMEALNELDELETRFESLNGQYQDLTQAKESLERIIQKINADSRHLFLETLEAIRANFQVLYRRAFGGGKADIVLEEGVDVLECGVEIMATPPGKPSFSNTLLSGGEKALTAVALLLAIFQYRPSPFCVLDEVDAPFDEANIGRFVDVLTDFLDWTKFVLVTHSKKTMTAAATLYGITMQESGISKQVAVRFEDVSEDGHIRSDALDREADGSDGQSDAPDSERGAA